MKTLAIMTFLLASSAFAHQIQPETKFFQDELKRDPMVGQVLAWCSLVGITNEESCRAEMYGKDETISQTKVEAASKCIDKSGLKYRVAFDEFFKTDMKKQGLLSHEVRGAIWHTYYAKDPSEGKNAVEHRHFYTDVDLQQAGLLMGDQFVDRLKRDYAKDVTSVTSSLSGAAGLTLGVPGTSGTGTVTKTGSETTTPAPLTEKQIAEARAAGDAMGRAHPETTAVTPHGVCDKGGDCFNPNGKVANIDATKREEAKSPSPKPEAPKEEPKPIKEEKPTDPFAPFTKDSDTGGAKTSEIDPTKDKEKGVSTPVNDPRFTSEMNDCVSVEENNILKNEGAKTKDQDAKTEEEKKTEAEELLSRGVCDSEYFGAKYCADWKNEQAKSHSQNAEADKQAAYEEAFRNWQANGICDPMVLGFAFCQNAHSQLVTTPTDSENLETGTIKDGVTQPDSVVPVDDEHISTDPNAWHPPETTTAQPE